MTQKKETVRKERKDVTVSVPMATVVIGGEEREAVKKPQKKE